MDITETFRSLLKKKQGKPLPVEIGICDKQPGFQEMRLISECLHTLRQQIMNAKELDDDVSSRVTNIYIYIFIYLYMYMYYIHAYYIHIYHI